MMFTGIIETMGTIADIRSDGGGGKHIRIHAPEITATLQVDDSVAVNGLCLTVVNKENDSFETEALPESVRRSTLSSWNKGQKVNLERGMPAGGRFDGHLVQGHVDTTAQLRSRNKMGRGFWLEFETDTDIGNLIVEKGSIAIDGVSLTLSAAGNGRFSVVLIPYTLEHTTLGNLRKDDKVNIETDIIGKYVVRQMGANKNLTEELLKKWGYQW
jgi:riboflavin synthase